MRATRQSLGLVGRGCHYRQCSRLSSITTRPWQQRAPSNLRRRYSSGKLGALKSLLKVSDEVQDAMATNKPVVALESTIYTHGALANNLPSELEGIVRKNGGVPAVVGILEGMPTVGLSPTEIDRMVESSPKKVSRRDIAYLVGMGMTGQKINGGTTIAGTMVLARLAGIRVFGTGGLGGVHRGGHDSLDISADLTELGRTRMAVIAAGSKGFLDIPRTLEYLETQGVHVSTFADGRTGNVDFPAFWARDSGVKSPSVVETEEQAAAMILAQEELGIESGLIFANPIPEEHSIPKSEMDAIIEQAIQEATEQGAGGNENTPFILRRIRVLTNGRSVPANKALVMANVERATRIAVAVSRFISGDLVVPSSNKLEEQESKKAYPGAQVPEKFDIVDSFSTKADVLVAGSVAVDLSCDYTRAKDENDTSPQLNTSNPARISQSIGGVGRNVALAAHRVSGDMTVKLCSMVGDDIAGSTVLASLKSAGMDTSLIRQLPSTTPGSRTAQYVAINDANKSLVFAMADMDIFTTHSFPQHWANVVSQAKPKWLVVDANWAAKDMRSWIQAGKQNGAQVAFEPVSKAKSAQLFCKGGESLRVGSLGVYPNQSIDLSSPNQYELAAMHAAAQANEYFDDARWWDVIDALGMRGARDKFVRLTSAQMTDAGIPQQAVRLLPYIPTLLTKMGAEGALLTAILACDHPLLDDAAAKPYILSRNVNDHAHVGGVYMRLFPSVEMVKDEEVVSVNGVGDTFLGVLIAGLARGGNVRELVHVAQKGAVLTLKSKESVSDELERLEGEVGVVADRG